MSGTKLTADEAAFLADARPAGVIIFARNVDESDLLKRLVSDAAEAAGGALVFVDQEGGRVQRIKPPLAPRYPAARRIGDLYAADAAAGERAAYLSGLLIAADCLTFGIKVPCLPVCDVPVPGMTDAIGDRAYAIDPTVVTRLATAAAKGVEDAGALPVIKHMPGHGRATVDTHLELPTVRAGLDELEADFAPFKALSHLAIGMTAHIRFMAIDDSAPATLSSSVISLIRHTIGFGGLLLTDDISMHALPGPVERDGAGALAAGCDLVTHCNGNMAEMVALAHTLPAMREDTAARLAAATAQLRPADVDRAAMLREFEGLIAHHSAG